MELRKLQSTGGSSLTVTLPKWWIDKVRVDAGDVIGFVEQPDGSLVVHPHAKGQRTLQTYTIDLGEVQREHLFRKIIAAYLSGYDAIRVVAKRPIPPASRLMVRRAVRRIMGLEIVDEEPNLIVLQDFLDPRQFHMDKALRRMGLLTQAMQEEALAAIATPSEDALKSLSDRDDEVDRLYWLVNKQYHAMLREASYAAKMELTPGQALNFLLIARLMERTADHANRIAEQALLLASERIPEPTRARVERQARRAVDLFRDAVLTFHRRDAAAANEVIDQATEFARSQEKALKEVTALGGEAVAHLAFILESIGRTAAYAADVSEVAINHKVAMAD